MTSQLESKRHSLAHLLAAAVMELWPDTKRTIGPAIDDGFYYDFDFVNKITEADLEKIEAKMREIYKTWDKFTGREVTAAEAKKEFKGNQYKLELIDEFSQDGSKLTFYQSGEFDEEDAGDHDGGGEPSVLRWFIFKKKIAVLHYRQLIAADIDQPVFVKADAITHTPDRGRRTELRPNAGR